VAEEAVHFVARDPVAADECRSRQRLRVTAGEADGAGEVDDQSQRVSRRRLVRAAGKGDPVAAGRRHCAALSRSALRRHGGALRTGRPGNSRPASRWAARPPSHIQHDPRLLMRGAGRHCLVPSGPTGPSLRLTMSRPSLEQRCRFGVVLGTVQSLSLTGLWMPGSGPPFPGDTASLLPVLPAGTRWRHTSKP
jgi:hypothetical protein